MALSKSTTSTSLHQPPSLKSLWSSLLRYSITVRTSIGYEKRKKNASIHVSTATVLSIRKNAMPSVKVPRTPLPPLSTITPPVPFTEARNSRVWRLQIESSSIPTLKIGWYLDAIFRLSSINFKSSFSFSCVILRYQSDTYLYCYRLLSSLDHNPQYI